MVGTSVEKRSLLNCEFDGSNPRGDMYFTLLSQLPTYICKCLTTIFLANDKGKHSNETCTSKNSHNSRKTYKPSQMEPVASSLMYKMLVMMIIKLWMVKPSGKLTGIGGESSWACGAGAAKISVATLISTRMHTTFLEHPIWNNNGLFICFS